MKKYIKGDGVVYSRSSRPGVVKGPPGEAEILALNPNRTKLILKKTNWKMLCAGTLNLRVDNVFLNSVDQLFPLFTEPVVNYPEKFQRLAKRRNGYRYWKCRLKIGDLRIKCLARLANNRANRVIEILAETNIREALNLQDTNVVNVKVMSENSKPIDIPTNITHYLRNRKDEVVNIENNMKGSSLFIIAGGPSFSKVSVKHKKQLAYCMTMGINNSPKAFTKYFRPNYWTCVDGPDKFLHTIWEDPTIMKLVPESHKKKRLWNSDTNLPVKRTVSGCSNVLFWKRGTGFNAKTFLTEPVVNWGNDKNTRDKNGVNGKRSVFHAALKLAYVLGFKNVYLLGVDFNMSETSKYAFEQDRTASSIKGNNASYKQMNYRFTQAQPYFLKKNFNVYNCNKQSGLTAFPYKPITTAIKEALDFVDDSEKYIKGELENTLGLYETKWYVCSKCDLAQRHSKQDIIKGIDCVCGTKLLEKNRDKRVYNEK